MVLHNVVESFLELVCLQYVQEGFLKLTFAVCDNSSICGCNAERTGLSAAQQRAY